MAERVGKPAFVNQQKAIMTRNDHREKLAAFTCPTLVLAGRQDVLTPVACHEYMAGEIPDARLVIVEEAGHLAPMERPEAVTAEMRVWLGTEN